MIGPEVNRALRERSAVVALESAVVTHGLPYPTNLDVARDLEVVVRQEGATPATIAVTGGQVHVGITTEDAGLLAQARSSRKIGPRDLASAALRKYDGGTTVGATILIADRVGISVFATGGIGGVHRESPYDVSADLRMLATTPIIVVCAGAKAILDLPATLEYLETMCVPVVGYQTDEFPAFYSRESGLRVQLRLDSPSEIAEFWSMHLQQGTGGAVLLTNPIPEASAIPREWIQPILEQASQEARGRGIGGGELTPYLLRRLGELSGGRTVKANVDLLVSNARLAAQIALSLVDKDIRKERLT
jgi:pseudouridylate synthase